MPTCMRQPKSGGSVAHRAKRPLFVHPARNSCSERNFGDAPPWILRKGPEAGPFLCNLDPLMMLGGLLLGLPG